eukprot:GILI01059036.1.p1 GENE.GILI01059036.1~~GILI01059036.1.p1  ORF type:complete len:203 (+),score=12.54 GILI01059036.1:41-610(+)
MAKENMAPEEICCENQDGGKSNMSESESLWRARSDGGKKAIMPVEDYDEEDDEDGEESSVDEFESDGGDDSDDDNASESDDDSAAVELTQSVSIACLPGNRLLCCSSPHHLVLWELDQGLCSNLRVFDGQLLSLCYLPDRTLVCNDKFWNVVVIDGKTAGIMKKFPLSVKQRRWKNRTNDCLWCREGWL